MLICDRGLQNFDFGQFISDQILKGMGLNNYKNALGLILLSASFAACADSFLRIKCEDNNLGAEIFLNGKLVGECPVDAPAQEGTVELLARKMVDQDHEQIFTKQIKVIEGVPQRIEIFLQPPQLTSEAIRRREIAEAKSQLQSAEAGNAVAMKKVAGYYEIGFGVAKDVDKAVSWRNRAEEAIAQSLMLPARDGDVSAMLELANRYDSGKGVKKDLPQARMWREKAETTKRAILAKKEAADLERKAQEKAQDKARRIDEVSYFSVTKYMIEDIKKVPNEDARSTSVMLWTTELPIFLLLDAISAPYRTTQIQQIENEASLRPSIWGKPNSMIARVSLQNNPSNKFGNISETVVR